MCYCKERKRGTHRSQQIISQTRKTYTGPLSTMFNRKRTLRKVKKHDPGSKRYNLHKQAKATLGVGNARLAVKKPDDETLEDWLAMNSTLDCFAPHSLLSN